MLPQIHTGEPLTWSQEIEQWLPGQEHDPGDYDTPGGETEFEICQSLKPTCTACGNA
jgi:hypothetical protein